MMFVQTDDFWVTANFREMQLKKIHPGQKMHIHVDSLGGGFRRLRAGHAGGIRRSDQRLPPENATGNYVKIVQRLSVRIRFSPNQHDLDRLRPGMSVEPKITFD